MAESQGGSQVVEYVEGAKQQAQVIGRKVEDYLRSTKKFQAACDDAFNKVDGRGVGKLSVDQCADACVIFFKDISTSVDDFGKAPHKPPSRWGFFVTVLSIALHACIRGCMHGDKCAY